MENRNGIIVYMVCFDLLKKLNHIKWDCNRWFLYGSLLFFSFDKFSTFFMGTVSDKKISLCKNYRIIHVELIDNIDLRMEDFNKECMMVESGIFFQPYYYVMKALQSFNRTNFPMERYIVEVNPVIKPPAYLTIPGLNYFKIDKFDNIDVLNKMAWPSSENLSLNKYQYDAFQSALTKEFVVMQGPPGTGKTFLGLKIVRTLLCQESLLEHLQSPILVVCYTNHALDQFLEGILNFTDSVVRVGSQSKSDIIKPYELIQVRKKFSRCKSTYISLKNKMENLISDIMYVENNLETIEKAQGIIDYRYLTEFMSPDHRNQLQSSDGIVNWLLPCDKCILIDVVEDEGDDDVMGQYKIHDGEDTEESDEEEVRKQMKDDAGFLDDIIVHEGNGIIALSSASIKRKINIIENLKREQNNKPREDYEHQLEILKNTIGTLEENLKNISTNISIKNSNNRVKNNLQFLDINKRWALYNSWLNDFRTSLIRKRKTLLLNYQRLAQHLNEARLMQDLEVVSKHQVLGTTTTTAAKYHKMFAALKPKIVVVEEAAEVLEAHIISALTKSCEHLILIGDHQQLRPNPAVYELAKKYNLEVSLFERMINNKLSFSTLGVQHRMRAEISDLITPVIYPNLENHSSVYGYGDVKGVTKNLFFISHQEEELNDENIRSFRNPYEAGFVLQLARYLLQQGYAPDEITILTTYSGQLIYIKREQKNNIPQLNGVRISTVDSYQGEESKIILLSLVRSNSENKIGFLSIPNRVCVALSRAKVGLYLIGNMESLTNGSEIWPKIKKQIELHSSIGPELELQCNGHNHKTKVSTKEDFSQVPEGGCFRLCDAVLTCGHGLCKNFCHPRDREHKDQYKCKEKCLKPCHENHPCQKKCYEECLCNEMVTRKLKCGHTAKLQCYMDPTEHLCLVNVDFKFELCGHNANVKCFILTSEVKVNCPIQCDSRLQCGHTCMKTCHLDEDSDHIDYECMMDCVKKNPCGHTCRKFCHESCSPCAEPVIIKLPCKHELLIICHQKNIPMECKEPCNRKFNCGHGCELLCNQACGDCLVEVQKLIPECGHTAKMTCGTKPNIKLCKERCNKMLNCGHQCSKKCNELCSISDCSVLVELPSVTSFCGHVTRVPCRYQHLSEKDIKSLALKLCKEPCNETLVCMHKCGGTCSDCKQGRLHVVCNKQCGRIKICGHICRADCRELCPPCKEPCLTGCDHLKCDRICGEKCMPCNKPCRWRCKHFKCARKCSEICTRPRCYKDCPKLLKCGHPCIGFCGEPCLCKCRICDKDEVTEIFFGNEDKPNARFVLLENCGHYFESSALEKYMGVEDVFNLEEVEIGMKLCPRCKTPIMSTYRFMSQIKSVREDIAQIKKIKAAKYITFRTLKWHLKSRVDALRNFKVGETNHEFLMKTTKFKMIMDDISSKLSCPKSEHLLKKKENSNHLSQDKINLLIFLVECMEAIKKRVLNIKTTFNAQDSTMLRTYFDYFVLDPMLNINSFEKLSEQQKFDIYCEVNRYFALTNLFELKSLIDCTPYFRDSALNSSYNKIFADILCLKKYDSIISFTVDDLLLTLGESLHKYLPTDLQLVVSQIIHTVHIKFFGLNRLQNQLGVPGKWFKCSKRHFYFISEFDCCIYTSGCKICNEIVEYV